MLSFVTIAIMLSKSTLHAIGQLVSLFRGQGSKQGQLSNPTGVAVNGEGHLFIAEHYNHKISVFTEDGQSLVHVTMEQATLNSLVALYVI